MDDDDYPNYGDAFQAQKQVSTPNEQASWNPARRPNTQQEAHLMKADDEFEERLTVSKQTTDELEETADEAIEPEDQHELHDPQDVEAQDSTQIDEPAASYEYQGDATELEEAIDESAEAPLILDEQPLPTVATLSREATLALDEDIKPVQINSRSFTTNFTEIPEVDGAARPSTHLPNDWPAAGDDKTFEELLGDERPAAPVAAVEEDMSAAWAAALDDDDILEEPNEMDPSSFFGGDDDEDGFLEDEPAPSTVQAARPAQLRSTSAYVPGSAQSVGAPSPFAAPTSPFIDQSHARGPDTPSTGLYDVYTQGNVAVQQARPALSSAQSFADKPRSGYTSPYDLPMEVVKTRRRPAPVPTAPSIGAAPPRTSSFGATSMASPMGALSPPSSSHGPPQGSPSLSATSAPSAKNTPSLDPGFFADLPVTSKPRSRVSGAYTPQSTGLPTPPLGPGQSQFAPQAGPGAHAPPRPGSAYAPSNVQPQAATMGGLRQPEQAPLFPEQITPPSTANSAAPPPQLSSRYSPAPQAVPSAPRYSPAAAGQPKTSQRYSSSPSAIPSLPPTRASQSFVPRTSSPLAVHGRPQQPELSAEQLRSLSANLPGSPGKSFEYTDRRGSATSRYAPSVASIPGESPSETNAFSPRRQRTQSPSEFRKIAPLTHAPGASLLGSQATEQAAQGMRLTHKRQFSRDLAFAVPNDERAHDPLERWKGHAIYHSHPSGAMVSSIPKQTPFYGAGGNAPSVKCTAGDVKLLDANVVLPVDEVDAKYPGPLNARAKGKKKDVLSWITLKISILEQHHNAAKLDFNLSELDRRAVEEKLLLWQIMRLYVENDGVLEGTPKLETEVRQLMIPDLEQKSQIVDLQSPTANNSTGDVTDTSTLYQIRQALFEGQRERAVLIAEEKKLWGHAMLIASTMGPDHFKQIVASFVRSQVKSQSSSELKSLSALYQVFAGSPEDCVDELVPPSARAGFQMISTTDGRGSVGSLTGLDQWRETLSLMHSNPTQGNAASLLAIGRLLADYGRFEAAHICYLFARSLAKHSGADDSEAHFVLLGADAANGHFDLDSLMLTEVYEYATSLSAASTAVHYIPHLQSYKLLHARYLAAAGHKAQAQSFCEHIDAAIRSTTRPSGYYHQAFAQELLSFNALLSQSPQAGSSGGKFFSRPAIDKVSSGMGSWFTKFVSGDEGETESNASGQGGAEGESFGPFSGVNGSTGPISRTTSSVDLQNQAAFSPIPLMQPFSPSSLPNRYTPVSQGNTSKYAPAYPASHASFDSERSTFVPGPAAMPTESVRSTSGRYAPANAIESPALLGVQSAAISRRASNQSLTSTGSYEPRPLLAENDSYGYAPPTFEPEPSVPAVTLDAPISNGVAPASHDDEPEVNGYAPPTMDYEPPTYQPYQPEAEAQEEDAPKPKKKSFMDDDDDDFAQRAAALKSKPSAAPSASRDVDPAIAAAAAADAARDASKGHSSRESGSWFGGWFGKKDPNAAPGPIKAKLGEQSSFYFDKDLNKWVNGKAGAEATTAAASTPPPPRAPGTPVGSAPSSRAPSGAMPPPGSGPPSRQGTPANASLPPKAAPGPGGPVQGLMPPPARPASSMSTASSLDDLLGGPAGGKKAGGAKAKKKGRYVDVMASS